MTSVTTPAAVCTAEDIESDIFLEKKSPIRAPAITAAQFTSTAIIRGSPP